MNNLFRYFAAGFVLGAGMIFPFNKANAQSPGRFTLSSPAFLHNQPIPPKYTCKGADINPPLLISGIPEGTKTLALIVDDPDAPSGTWVHWVVYNIPPGPEIKENSVPGVEGTNDSGGTSYGGPCPPSGMHRYFFKLYALDETISISKTISKKLLLDAMRGHILSETNLMGTFAK